MQGSRSIRRLPGRARRSPSWRRPAAATALPSLILGAPPERILDLSHCDPRSRLAHEEQGRVLAFVDRGARRRQLWNRLWTDTQLAPRIFAVTGPVKAGKGSLVRWCLGVASVLGFPTVLAEIRDDEAVDSIGFLSALVEALRDSNGGVSAELDSLEVDLLDYQYEKDRAELRDEPYEKTQLSVPEVTGVLAVLAGNGPWSSASTGLRECSTVCGGHMRCPVSSSRSRRRSRYVRLIVGLQENELDIWFPRRHVERDQIEDIPIKLFPSDQFVDLISQRQRALGYKHESFKGLLDYWEERVNARGNWDTDLFESFDHNAIAEGWEEEE